MSDSVPWLYERPDRVDLIQWLAIHAARGGEFLFRTLADLLDRGALSTAQEEAVRRCRARVLARAARSHVPEQRRSHRRCANPAAAATSRTTGLEARP
jgi:hypothetical protein